MVNTRIWSKKTWTTQLKPYEFFTEVEQPILLPLPEVEYEISEWKQVKVHPDCFIQINKKSYSVPYQYVGKTLFAKAKSRTVEIYYNEELIKQHLIPKNNRQTDYEDFPENIQKALDGNLPAYLLREAERVSGNNLRNLIEKILAPHAFIKHEAGTGNNIHRKKLQQQRCRRSSSNMYGGTYKSSSERF